MKKSFAVLLILVLLCASSNALAAGKLSVTQENFWVVSDWSTYAYAYAKVENVGNKPIKVNAGVLEVYDKEGDAITSTDYMNAYAAYLQPGEYTYARLYTEIKEKEQVEQVDDYMLTITGKSDSSRYNLRLPVETELQLDVKDGWATHNYMYVTITNNTEEPIYNIAVVIALLDADGNILTLDSNSLYSFAITPGSSIILREEISSSLMEYCEKNGITPASADAIAFVEVEAK